MFPPTIRRASLAVSASFVLLCTFIAAPAKALPSQADQIQVASPMRPTLSPPEDATADELEKQGDALRSRKLYLDAMDYFHGALKKSPNNANVYNKLGICELMLQRPKDAAKDFEQAVRRDKKFADGYNNLGVTEYVRHKYGAAVRHYKKALELAAGTASYYNNLGAAYFARKDFERASQAYTEAVHLDPDIFERSSHTGVAAQVASPEDRAHYWFVLAKLYAKINDSDHSLAFLRKAMESGYKSVSDAYTDPEFATLRKDNRFSDLMKGKPVAIPE
jgi:tetratricopeptide (TPR) repeat protein